MVRFKVHLLIMLATLAVPADLVGQAPQVHRLPEWHAAFPMPGSPSIRETQATAHFRKASAATNDYRWEGLIIGGVAVGLFGAALGASFCGYGNASGDDGGCFTQTLGGGLMGALVGGVTGGLIGSQISR